MKKIIFKSAFILISGFCFIISLRTQANLPIMKKLRVPVWDVDTTATRYLKDTSHTMVDYYVGCILDEIIKSPLAGQPELKYYYFVQPDTGIHDQFEIIRLSQQCPIDLATPEGLKVARQRFYFFASVLAYQFNGKRMLHEPASFEDSKNEKIKFYILGWFRLKSGFIFSLNFYFDIYYWKWRYHVKPLEREVYLENTWLLVPEELDTLPCNNNKSAGVNVGEIIRDISLPDLKGKTLSIANFRGKYVYIDFWASWCGPCRESFPELAKKYLKYKDKEFKTGEKGFTVFTISIDTNKEDWIKAVEKDNVPWPNQVIDIIGWEGLVTQFGMTGIPRGILIDGNGKIISHYARLDEVWLDANLK